MLGANDEHTAGHHLDHSDRRTRPQYFRRTRLHWRGERRDGYMLFSSTPHTQGSLIAEYKALGRTSSMPPTIRAFSA